MNPTQTKQRTRLCEPSYAQRKFTRSFRKCLKYFKVTNSSHGESEGSPCLDKTPPQTPEDSDLVKPSVHGPRGARALHSHPTAQHTAGRETFVEQT